MRARISLVVLSIGLAVSIATPAWGADTDEDGIEDASDNCSELPNAGYQNCDTDQDGYGNACDGDFDQDQFVLHPDLIDHWFPDFRNTGFDGGTGTDMDCDGYVLPIDRDAYWDVQFTGSGIPGPSGLACAGSVPCP